MQWQFQPNQSVHLELVYYSDAVAFGTRQFGGGAGPIYLDNVACSGSESTLLDCSRSSFVSCYSWRRGAGVRCQGIELMIILI